MRNADMPVNPITDENGAMSAGSAWVWSNRNECIGLTKREYFAGLAMQALSTADSSFAMTEAEVATHAVAQADALLAELEKEAQP